jgi:hypothetical protein
MGAIFLDLARTSEAWKSTFDDDADADRYHHRLVEEVAALRHVVLASADAELIRLPANHQRRLWAEVSKVEVLFLTDQSGQRIVNRYRDAIPRDQASVWDAARGQLELFAELGVRADLAEEVMQGVNRKFDEPVASPRRPLHVVLFAGHRIDRPGRPQPRFPASRADRARTLIHDALRRLVSSDMELIGFASAAPGGDILFHEVCDDLRVRSIPCLPMPASSYSSHTFRDIDDWRSRFLALLDRNRERRWDVLELSDQEGLPRWLQGTSINSWERGNRWVLQIGLAAGARRITLLALWDGHSMGDDRGGTAQMVELARSAGTIDVKRIDSAQLLSE